MGPGHGEGGGASARAAEIPTTWEGGGASRVGVGRWFWDCIADNSQGRRVTCSEAPGPTPEARAHAWTVFLHHAHSYSRTLPISASARFENTELASNLIVHRRRLRSRGCRRPVRAGPSLVWVPRAPVKRRSAVNTGHSRFSREFGGSSAFPVGASVGLVSTGEGGEDAFYLTFVRDERGCCKLQVPA